MDRNMKRAELHVYTKHTTGCVGSFEDMTAAAGMKGVSAIAFADLGTTAGLYESQRYGRNGVDDNDLKTICGAEVYIVDDRHGITNNLTSGHSLHDYVVIDIETTGLSASANEIIEIAAIKVIKGIAKDRYHSFVKPEKRIPEKITELTGINDDMVNDAASIDKILPEVLAFIGDSVVVGYNVDFDIHFLSAKAGQELLLPSVDALKLARVLLPDLKHHTLASVTEELGIGGNRHTAKDDAEATRQVYEYLLSELRERGVSPEDINRNLAFRNPVPYPDKAVILVGNGIGMRNLNVLLSDADMTARNDGKPCIRKSEIERRREGLLVGSTAIDGEIIKGILGGRTKEALAKLLSFYDYAEICHPETLQQWAKKRREDRSWNVEEVQSLIKSLYDMCAENQVPLVAVSGAYYPIAEDYRAHQIACDYFETDERKGSHIRTTEELTESFAFLGKKNAEDVVINNTVGIADRISLESPIVNGMKQLPMWKGMNEELRRICEEKAHFLYGDILPEEVSERLDRELKGICDNGFAACFLLIYELFDKSDIREGEYHYRGSNGNSFVLYLLGINGVVNPLKPHYRCESADYSEFPETDAVMGYKLPEKVCPVCGKKLIKDGFGLAEYFWTGYEHDKEPCFELNILSSKRKTMYEQVGRLKGVGDALFCGTTHSLYFSRRTEKIIIDDYAKKHGIDITDEERTALIEKLSGCVTGYGKHPGRVMLIPDYAGRTEEIFAVRKGKNGEKISIPDYYDYDNIFYSIDLLWSSQLDHLVRVADLTGIPQESISLDDEDVAKELVLSGEEKISGMTGMYDLWSQFAAEVLQMCQVKDFAGLVKLLSLIHGTGVWTGNGEEIISQEKAGFDEIIASRDDIFDYLVGIGFSDRDSFKIAERVRKGKGLLPEQEEDLIGKGVPEWYIQSCNKIRYLFPRAHSLSYAVVHWRLLYFRSHYPEQFYRAYLECVHITDCARELIASGVDAIQKRLEEISMEQIQENDIYGPVDRSEEHALQVALLMYERGYRIPQIGK